MADTKVAFELVAPERLLASIDADMVVIPGADGDFGVLPNHAPLMSLLRPGVISVSSMPMIWAQPPRPRATISAGKPTRIMLFMLVSIRKPPGC